MPASTTPSRPSELLATVRLDTAISQPTNVVTIPTKTMLPALLARLTGPFHPLPRLAFLEERQRRCDAEGKEPQKQALLETKTAPLNVAQTYPVSVRLAEQRVRFRSDLDVLKRA